MQRIAVSSLSLCLLLIVPLGLTRADVIGLYDWTFNIDGVMYENFGSDPLPGTGTLDDQGLGELTFNFTDAGSHSFIAWFDYEIDEATNTYFNEFGVTGGVLAAGESWEIDEPGYLFGDILDNVLAGNLDNSNGVPPTAPDDVSFALGWDFSLNPGETAQITLTLSDVLDVMGDQFYISQIDPEAGPDFDQTHAVYAWSSLARSVAVPEPASLLLMIIGLIVVAMMRRDTGRESARA